MITIVSGVDSVNKHDKRIVSETLLEIPNIGVNMCAAECLLYHDCLSVDYHIEKFICQLNTEDSEVFDAKNYKYATKSDLKSVPNAKVGHHHATVKLQ
ncbi:hypothetical protein MHBO_002264 [Bonamia ostreae]|uniref:Apple domain-containing protein n=1 Tax=Bonamia ostreae TaxID=126728 RepID=A0ABV2ALQ8_9EUKA